MNKFSITVAVRDGEMSIPVLKSLHPLRADVLIGKDYPSFSKLVNTVINNSKEEIVIFCSHRVRPTPSDVERILELLNAGYGLVGLYRFAFFGLKKELIRRIGFMDETFIGGEYEDNDFVIRLKESDMAYYEDHSVEYHHGISTWNNSKTLAIFNSKWEVTATTIKRLKNDPLFDYDLGINSDLASIETNKIFLSWDKSCYDPNGCSTIKNYFDKQIINISKSPPLKLLEQNVRPTPIHLRNIPPPLETFNHPSMLEFFAKWLRPTFYVEFGIREGTSLSAVAPFCAKVHGVDINPINSSLTEKFNQFIFYQMTTDDYVSNVIGKIIPRPIIDMAFIDACHESNQVFKDFEGLFPYVMEDGFIFLHDTYPYDKIMTAPDMCNDCYKVPLMIKEKYGNMCELLTLPFNPGLTIVKKKINPLPAFLN